MANPLSWAGFGLQAASGIGSLISGNKQQKAQERENEKNRQFNAEQARLNREFQRSESRYNLAYQAQYNSPAAQVQRLKDAGLNPALAYGNSNTGMVSAQSASGSQASASGSSLGGESLRAAGFQQLGQSAMENAQIQAINTKRKGDELDNLAKQTDLAWQQLEKDQQFEINGLLIDAQEVKNEISKAELQETIQRVENLKQDFDNLKTQGVILEIERDLAKGQLDLFDATFDAQKQKIEDDARISHQTADLTTKYIISQIYLNNASGSNQSNQADEAYARAQDLSAKFEQAIKTGEYEIDGHKVKLNSYEAQSLAQMSGIIKSLCTNEATAYRNSVTYSVIQDIFMCISAVLGGYTALTDSDTEVSTYNYNDFDSEGNKTMSHTKTTTKKKRRWR